MVVNLHAERKKNVLKHMEMTCFIQLVYKIIYDFPDFFPRQK